MTLPLPGGNWALWGRSLVRSLEQRLGQLAFRRSDSSAAVNGAIMWDNDGYPVVSKDGAFHQIALANGHGQLATNTDHTAASADTQYKVTFSDPTDAGGVSRSGTQISISETGIYRISVQGNVESANVGQQTAYMWLEVDGAEVANSMVSVDVMALVTHAVATMDRLVQIDAGSYIEVCYAMSATDVRLGAQAATAFGPATPAALVAISRVAQ